MSRCLAIMLLCASLLGVAACEGNGDNGQPKGGQPDWWDETGSPWPPPRPDEWEGDWPPQDKELAWWVGHFHDRNGGDTIDPVNPDDLTEDGGAGDRGFAFGFTAIDRRKPDQECGLFRLHTFEGEAVNSCQPYPSQTIARLCDTALAPAAALAECVRQCSGQKKCPNANLYYPEMYAHWGCDTPILSQIAGVRDFYASCGGVFLCECEE